MYGVAQLYWPGFCGRSDRYRELPPYKPQVSAPVQPCRRREEKGLFPFWPCGAFVNGRAEEITTFGGGRGWRGSLTHPRSISSFVPCLTLIKMRARRRCQHCQQPRMQMRFCGGWMGGSIAAVPFPRVTSAEQMHGVFGRGEERRGAQPALPLPLIGGFI